MGVGAQGVPLHNRLHRPVSGGVALISTLNMIILPWHRLGVLVQQVNDRFFDEPPHRHAPLDGQDAGGIAQVMPRLNAPTSYSSVAAGARAAIRRFRWLAIPPNSYRLIVLFYRDQVRRAAGRDIVFFDSHAYCSSS
jgi:hypothetical protein